VTHDEKTGRLILPKEQLVHGRYYKGRCRNATIARWNAESQRFAYWRVKFDQIFVEALQHPADDPPSIDVFRVVDELQNPKFEIPLIPGIHDIQTKFTGDLRDLKEFESEMGAAGGVYVRRRYSALHLRLGRILARR
jgi:hypothetical protein